MWDVSNLFQSYNLFLSTISNYNISFREDFPQYAQQIGHCNHYSPRIVDVIHENDTLISYTNQLVISHHKSALQFIAIVNLANTQFSEDNVPHWNLRRTQKLVNPRYTFAHLAETQPKYIKKLASLYSSSIVLLFSTSSPNIILIPRILGYPPRTKTVTIIDKFLITDIDPIWNALNADMHFAYLVDLGTIPDRSYAQGDACCHNLFMCKTLNSA